MELSRLAAAASGRVVGASTPVADLAYRAQDATPGSLFVCLRGASADGHDFAAEALDRGAVALAVDHELDLAAPQVVVSDTRVAMAQLAVSFFGDPSAELDVVGVTGTNGKTTTTFLVHAVLEAAGRRPGLLGTIESRVGDERVSAVRTTPESADTQRTLRAMVDAGNRSVEMEATSHGSEHHRLDGVRFAALAFTNLGQDHLDFHGTMERYFEAKRRLFDAGPPAAVNVGDEWGRRLAARLPGDRLLTFVFTGRGALARGGLCGFLSAAAAAARAGLDGVPGRFEAIDEGQPFTVVVDYSHKPDALANVLETARALATGRVICVFGAGGDRDRAKRPVMGRIAADLADVAILTSDNPRSEDPRAIADEVAAGAPGELDLILDRREAIRRAVEVAAPGDVVVIAGKGHEQGQETAGRIEPFDDREVAREAIRALVTPA